MLRRIRSLFRFSFWVLSVLLTLAMLGAAQNVQKQAAQKEAPPAAEPAGRGLSRQAILKLLDEPMELALFKAGKMDQLKLKEFLQIIEKKFASRNIDLPIVIDVRAFMNEAPDAFGGGNAIDGMYDLEVKIPATARRLPVSTMLRFAIASFPQDNAAWMIRDGSIEITTVAMAGVARPMPTEFEAVFDRRPLASALRDLSDRTGFNIVLDARVADKSETPVTATFSNGIPLSTAVSLLADMAGLKTVDYLGVIYVTTSENADAILHERGQHDKARMKAMMGMPGGPQPPEEFPLRNAIVPRGIRKDAGAWLTPTQEPAILNRIASA